MIGVTGILLVTLPNFLIMGTARAGTTSVYRYLRQHRQIYMSDIKEPLFFALENKGVSFTSPSVQYFKQNAVTKLAQYESLFDGVTDQLAIGEASTMYMYSRRACERIRHHIPGAKLIVMLRHPAERAFSHFLHEVQRRREPLTDFGRALGAEAERMAMGWGWPYAYRDIGFYCRQLRVYFDSFPREQISIWLYDDLEADTDRVMADIMRFIGVESIAVDTSVHHNVACSISLPRSTALSTLICEDNAVKSLAQSFIPARLRRRVGTVLKRCNQKRPSMPAPLRRELIADYRDDILGLQDLIGRDLSHWLQ